MPPKSQQADEKMAGHIEQVSVVDGDRPIAIAKHSGIEEIEAQMLNMEPAKTHIQHHFGPGVYIREAFIPAGSVIMGHAHKHDHTCMLLRGRVVVLMGDEMVKIDAPTIFVSSPGRKMVCVVEDCSWVNVYATEETDLVKLEEMFVDKSDTLKDFEKQKG